jgi:hypothetical protein
MEMKILVGSSAAKPLILGSRGEINSIPFTPPAYRINDLMILELCID